MAAAVSWSFPRHDFSLLRIEKAMVLFVAVLIFFFSYIQLEKLPSAFLFTAIFIGLYLVVAYFIQQIRNAEEHYHLRGGHLLVVRKTRFSQKKEKIPLSKVKRHRLDRFFFGGYLLTGEGKHLLFFNTRKEIDAFERSLKKYLPI